MNLDSANAGMNFARFPQENTLKPIYIYGVLFFSLYLSDIYLNEHIEKNEIQNNDLYFLDNHLMEKQVFPSDVAEIFYVLQQNKPEQLRLLKFTVKDRTIMLKGKTSTLDRVQTWFLIWKKTKWGHNAQLHTYLDPNTSEHLFDLTLNFKE